VVADAESVVTDRANVVDNAMRVVMAPVLRTSSDGNQPSFV
jgi:hypothetical protein